MFFVATLFFSTFSMVSSSLAILHKYGPYFALIPIFGTFAVAYIINHVLFAKTIGRSSKSFFVFHAVAVVVSFIAFGISYLTPGF